MVTAVSVVRSSHVLVTSMSGQTPYGLDLGDPEWFLHDLDPASGRAGFVRTDRAGLSAQPFLDHRWRAAADSDAAMPLADLPPQGSAPPRLNFIWHTSYCASTLLAACLDCAGVNLSLKEPRALTILAALQQTTPAARFEPLARSVFGLMARRFEPDEQILIKPSNGANTLMPAAAALTQGRMLLLYSDCESFVLSMARQGQAGFAFVRESFAILAALGHPAGRWPSQDLLKLTDLEMAALVWRMRMDAFETASHHLGERAYALNSQDFLRDPRLVLLRLDEVFGLGLGAERIDAVVGGPLFARDAKRPGEAFDARARSSQKDQLRKRLGADLPAVLQSMDEVFRRPPRLGNPLVG